MTDVVVIGADANSLVAADLLARAGRTVTVLQEEPPRSRTVGWVPAQLARALGLSALSVEWPDPWLRAPLPDGGVLELSRDMARSVEAIRRVSARDAESWPRFCKRTATLARLLERLYVEAPPSLVDLRFALRLRRLGRQGMEDLMRLLPMPAAELLDDWFESDVLKGALGAHAVRHLQQGPRSAGTAFRLLHYHAGNPPGVFRAPTSNLAQLLRARPAIAVREAQAARIAVRGGQVTGIVLEGGEELRASLVVSAAHPRRTLAELVEPGWLDPDLTRALRHIRSRGVAAKIALAFERAPEWKTLTLAPSLDYVERAYDDVKYGRVSARPWLDVSGEGKGGEVHVQYTPHAKSDDPNLGALVSKLLAPHSPPITECRLVAPPASWPEGQPHQAELALDQALWMRPLPELSGYRTPIGGLWLCGQAMHPAVPGVAGYNCARAILRSA
jgi:phytoene dehydrogenase-like protein